MSKKAKKTSVGWRANAALNAEFRDWCHATRAGLYGDNLDASLFLWMRLPDETRAFVKMAAAGMIQMDEAWWKEWVSGLAVKLSACGPNTPARKPKG